MWRLIIFLLFLILSVWLGIEMVRNPAFLFVVFHSRTIEMPLWFALSVLFLIFILFYILIASIDKVHLLWYQFKNWLRFRRQLKSYSKTQRGLTALIEGRFQKAEQLLLQGVTQTIEPLINYLAAAKAAHEQKAYDRRDNYIQKAYQIAPNENLSIGLTQAKLEFNQDQLEHAEATLTHLRQCSPRHPGVLKMLEKVYVRLADWKNLQTLLPSLRKAKLITKEQEGQFEKNIYCEILDASHQSLTDVQKTYHDMPRAIKKNPEVITAYVKQLKRFEPISGPEVSNQMEELIRQVLKNHWQSDLVDIYGKLPFNNINRQLIIVNAWLKMYGQRPELLLLLGNLCVRQKLWGKAKDYFEKCLAQGPNVQASLAYGKLLEQLGETDLALQKYREGLA